MRNNKRDEGKKGVGLEVGWVELQREKIIEIVRQIENLGTLQYLYKFLELFFEKWG